MRAVTHGVQQVDGAIVPPAVCDPVLAVPILHEGRGQLGFLQRMDGLMEIQRVAAVDKAVYRICTEYQPPGRMCSCAASSMPCTSCK